MSVYEREKTFVGSESQSHALSVLVENQVGALARVVSMFSARGYNIDSLTVAKVATDENISRITIITTGTLLKIEQIKSQLGRIVVVHKVVDLTTEGPFVSRELIFVKVKCKGEKRLEALRTADIFRAKVVDSTKQSFIFELTGSSEKLDAFVSLMKELGLIELARTGAVAISRGSSKIN
ncbi:MAG: acetolactate synthase small subunit [Rickettsiales bacterium TMED251]|nr:MAG: acetolactate synthase small subunit [Rickettsiales bacterium TMED251]|tara:strand:+ start:54 stop:593 length:540 start_codon:yes stop_codon:yes gene_type:complete